MIRSKLDWFYIYVFKQNELPIFSCLRMKFLLSRRNKKPPCMMGRLFSVHSIFYSITNFFVMFNPLDVILTK